MDPNIVVSSMGQSVKWNQSLPSAVFEDMLSIEKNIKNTELKLSQISHILQKNGSTVDSNLKPRLQHIQSLLNAAAISLPKFNEYEPV